MLGRLHVADCVGLLFWRRKENDILIVGEFAKMFETLLGVELSKAIKRVQCVTRVGTVFSGKTP